MLNFKEVLFMMMFFSKLVRFFQFPVFCDIRVVYTP
jgi:hypothetical protein